MPSATPIKKLIPCAHCHSKGTRASNVNTPINTPIGRAREAPPTRSVFQVCPKQARSERCETKPTELRSQRSQPPRSQSHTRVLEVSIAALPAPPRGSIPPPPPAIPVTTTGIASARSASLPPIPTAFAAVAAAAAAAVAATTSRVAAAEVTRVLDRRGTLLLRGRAAAAGRSRGLLGVCRRSCGRSRARRGG